MDRYRFKTRKEFEHEFGPKWFEEVSCGWDGAMDEFFDVEVPEHVVSQLLNHTGCAYWVNRYDTWQISWDMVTEICPTEVSKQVQSQTNKNNYVGKVNQIPRVTPQIRRGEKPIGRVCLGRTKTVRVEVGYLSHEALSSSC